MAPPSKVDPPRQRDGRQERGGIALRLFRRLRSAKEKTMLKTILATGAMLLAVPALAQTGGTMGADTGKPGTSAPATTDTTGAPASTSTTGDSGWGTGETTATTGAAAPAAPATTGAYTGQGGPYEAKSYPPCTRTRTDSCTQMRGRSRR
jgi:hypothetical protein